MFIAVKQAASAAARAARDAADAATAAAAAATGPRALREHAVDLDAPAASCGPWLIYEARRKRQGVGEREGANVFFHARGRGRRVVPPPGPVKHPAVSVWILRKSVGPAGVAAARRGAAALARVRHPGVLRVVDALEETKTSLVIVTEAVSASAADALITRFEGLPGADPALVAAPPSALDVKAGLAGAAAALAFLHADAATVHRGVSPTTLMLTRFGGWKLAGFDWAEPVAGVDAALGGGDAAPRPPPFDWSAPGPAAAAARPDVATAPPEAVPGPAAAAAAGDVFSWAATAVALLAREPASLPKGPALAQLAGGPPPAGIPADAWAALAPCLRADPNARPPAVALAATPWLARDPVLRALQAIADGGSAGRDPAARAGAWMEVASRAPLAALDARVRRTRLQPALLADARDVSLQPQTLPLLLAIVTGGDVGEADFDDAVLPALRPVAAHAAGAALALLARSAGALAAKTTPAAAADTLVPLVCRALEAGDARVAADALASAPAVGARAGPEATETHVLPRVHRTALSTTSAAARSAALRALAPLAGGLPRAAAAAACATLARVAAIDASPTTAAAGVDLVDALVKAWGPGLACGAGLPALAPLLAARDDAAFDAVLAAVRRHVDAVDKARGPRAAAKAAAAAAAPPPPLRSAPPTGHQPTRPAVSLSPLSPRVSSVDLSDDDAFGGLTAALPRLPPPPTRAVKAAAPALAPAPTSSPHDAFGDLMAASPARAPAPAGSPMRPSAVAGASPRESLI